MSEAAKQMQRIMIMRCEDVEVKKVVSFESKWCLEIIRQWLNADENPYNLNRKQLDAILVALGDFIGGRKTIPILVDVRTFESLQFIQVVLDGQILTSQFMLMSGENPVHYGRYSLHL